MDDDELGSPGHDDNPKTKEFPQTLPLSQHAIESLRDRLSKPQPLKLSGRPVTSPISPQHLKAKYKIGAATGPMNFARGQKVFIKEETHASKLKNVEELAAWKKERSGRCGVAPKWEQTTAKPDVIIPKRTRENHVHDRSHSFQYNYRAEVLPEKNLPHIPKPHKWGVNQHSQEFKETVRAARSADRRHQGVHKRTEEMPVNPRLIGKPEVRVALLTRQEQRALIARETVASRKASRRAIDCLPVEHYLTPEERYGHFLGQVRTLKSAGLTEGYAAAAAGLEEIPKHNRLAKEHSQKARTFAHSGVFEYNKLDDKWMWSDTGSYEKNSTGDVAKVNDPQAYNLEGPSLREGRPGYRP